METVREITVKDDQGHPVSQINELEYVDGFIYANVWYKNDILKIRPSDGTIVKKWDMTSIVEAEQRFQRDVKGQSEDDCLNGIAYNTSNNHFYLSGKKYHLIFEISLD